MKRTVFCAFISLAMMAIASTPGPATDVDAGKGVFTKRCAGCHALDADKEGPRLRGVFGRKAGTVAGFQYSDELRKSGISWNEATLKQWLENPQKMVPGTDMEFPVGDRGERDAVVAFLKSL